MATQVQSSKGQWIGISTAEETGAKFADGKGKCSWSAMLRCHQKFTKRLVGQPWRDFVKGESDFVKADTSYAARIEFIEHELELCGRDFKKPIDLYEKKEWSEDEGDEEKYTYLCTTLEDHEQNLI